MSIFNASKIFLLLLLSIQLKAQSARNLNLISTINIPGQQLAGCWHYEDGTGKAYALIGAQQGILILDITIPSNPVNLFQLPGVNSIWHEIKVQGDFAYAVSEGVDTAVVKNGMQIIDLRFLPDSAPTKFYQGDGSIENQLVKAHTITTSGNYVYINGHNISSLGSGVLICDISDPWNPHFVGAVTNNYCHDSFVRGDTLWTSDIQAGQFSVYNISNRANPQLLATQPTPGDFNHNTWLSDDSKTLFTTDERINEPLASFDVSDLSNITLLDEYLTSNMPASEVHNVRVLNDFLINPSYGSQITLVDAARPANLIEVGNFTTGSSLCWDADPYYSSGLIVATEKNSGNVFVLQPTYIRACYLEGSVTDSSTGIPLVGATITINGTSVTENSNSSGEYKTGLPDAGSYTITCVKNGYNPKTITGVSLNNGILTVRDFQLSLVGIGINEMEGENLFELYPNPATDLIRINSIAGSHEFSTMEIKSVTGALISKYTQSDLNPFAPDISISDLSPGFYFLVITSKESKTVLKFQKL